MKKRVAILFSLVLLLVIAAFILKPEILGFASKEITILPSKAISQELISAFDNNQEVRVIIQTKQKNQQQSILSNLEQSTRKPEFKLSHEYQNLNGFSGKITKSGLAKLQENPNIEKIYLDRKLKININDTVPLINADQVHNIQVNNINITGTDQSVCVIDSGIDYNHVALQGKTIAQYCYCSASDYGSGGCCPNNMNESSDAMDDDGHGTFVSGIIAVNYPPYYGVAPGANIVAIKTMNNNGEGYFSDAIKAIEWCTNNASLYNISVITMSLGTPSYHNSSDCDLDFPLETAAINNAIDSGITVIAASGNEFVKTGIASPACISNVLSVGATTKQDLITDYSNTNENLDLVAPGGSPESLIWSTCPDNEECGAYGTSAAAPHVAGTIALVQQYSNLYNNKNLTLDQIRSILKTRGISKIDSGNNLSFSRVDALNSINSILRTNEVEDSAENKYGKVDFSTITNLTNVSIAFYITNNSIYLNSSYTEFNKTTNLRLYNLIFENQPAILRDNEICSDCFISTYNSGNLSFNIAHFTNYTAVSNSELEIWDEADRNMSFYENSIVRNERVYFYANYTNRTSDIDIADASCYINFSDASSVMDYNSTAKVFQYNKSFANAGQYEFNISCNHSNFETSSTSEGFTVLVCGLPEPGVDWMLTESENIMCNNTLLYFQNQSLILNNTNLTIENANFVLINSSGYNLTILENASLAIQNSIIRSEVFGTPFNIYAYGRLNLQNVTLNESQLHLFGNRSYYIQNSKFYEEVYLQAKSINYIERSMFNNTLNIIENSTNIINNSNISSLIDIRDSTNTKIINSTISGQFKLFVNPVGSLQVNFTDIQSNITSDIYSGIAPNSNVIIAGLIDTPDIVTNFIGELTRYFPIYVYYNDGTTPVPNQLVNITDLNGNLIYNGTTNSDGFMDMPLLLNSTNYADGNFTIQTNPSSNASLLTDTPIIFSISESPPSDSTPTGGGSSCTPNWNCTIWSDCINGIRTRNCTDLNKCNKKSGKPIESESCLTSSSEQTSETSTYSGSSQSEIENPFAISGNINCPIPIWAIIILILIISLYIRFTYLYDKKKEILIKNIKELKYVNNLKAFSLIIILILCIYLYFHICLNYLWVKITLMVLSISLTILMITSLIRQKQLLEPKSEKKQKHKKKIKKKSKKPKKKTKK